MSDQTITQAELARRVERARTQLAECYAHERCHEVAYAAIGRVLSALAEPARAEPACTCDYQMHGDRTHNPECPQHGVRPSEPQPHDECAPAPEIEVGDRAQPSYKDCPSSVWAIRYCAANSDYDLVWFGTTAASHRKACILASKRADRSGDAFRLLKPHEDYKAGAIVIAKRSGHIHNAVLVVTDHDFYIPRDMLVRIALAPEAKP